MTSAPGAGSRARSRELGYADGMKEMYCLLRDGEQSWAQAELDALADGNTGAAQVMGKVGAWLRVYGDYAFDAWLLHDDYLGRFARDVEHREYLERERYCPPGPREFPRREQSENN